MSHIVILSGSPSAFSRSDKVLKYLGELLEKERFSVQYISVKDVPPEDLIYGKFDSPAIERISYDIQGAAGVIIGSPVYKAAYSGALKTLIDVLPQDAFKNKPVFPLMTGGSPAHLLAVEFSLKPLIASLKGHSLQGLYVLDSQIDKHLEGSPFLEDEILSRTKKRLHEFISAVNNNRLVAI
ncbi:NADPH-dependent FMN reductase [Siminovitchia terrae]|uniref:FMN reductase (NADPH) n=1 Tax=Siminovitchia terrae TaxID=1914933 RepID=A0A429X2B6_SIMTE|nr:NADPH-dependent FMN reductase [Siminovitchia terrae]RST57621.1 FMN reductase (NADPH) [Siminovitchia terrae]GIN93389.1 FMN reductase (NADPH) [Siminovitchia terrae]